MVAIARARARFGSLLALAALLSALLPWTLFVPTTSAKQIDIHVDDDATPGGNGSARSPYTNLPDAVVAARSDPGAVIKVEPGDYALAETLLIDRSLELRGSTKQVDTDDAWPTGEVVAGTETRVFSTNPGLSQLILVGRADASVLEDVSIRGFVLEGTATGISVLLTRVQDYLIADNVFRAPANFGMQSVASSGRVFGNHFSGLGTGAIFTGGFDASPSNVTFTGNRAVRNTLGGVLLNGASIRIPELGDRLDAIVRDNDISQNRVQPRASASDYASSSCGGISVRQVTPNPLPASARWSKTTESMETQSGWSSMRASPIAVSVASATIGSTQVPSTSSLPATHSPAVCWHPRW